MTTGSYYGLYLTGGGNHQVHDSRIDGNVYGVTLFESNGNTLQDNVFARQTHFSPGGYGIYLSHSTSNLIERNTIEDNINWGFGSAIRAATRSSATTSSAMTRR